LKEVVVRHDQAWFAQQKIEGEVLQTVMGISSRKYREAAVSHDGNIPDILDACPGAARISRHRLGIDRGKKAVELENFRTGR
jgi:hypothetical protein